VISTSSIIAGDVASRKTGKPLPQHVVPCRARPGDVTAFDDPNLVNTVIQPLP
jgi:hypothetical protein